MQKDTKALIARLKKEKLDDPLLVERLRKNGEPVMVWLTVTRLFDEKGRPEFVATTERDLNMLSIDTLQFLTGEDHA